MVTEETVYHIKNACNKIVQKRYKTRHSWVRKESKSDFGKRSKFDHVMSTNQNLSWLM